MIQHKIIPFEVKSTSGDGSTGEGYGNTFHAIDEAQEIVAPNAFDDTLSDFLKNGFIGGLNHDWSQPIGKPTKASVDAKGLLVGWNISDTAHGRDVKTLLKDGVITKLSIGYRVLGEEYLEDGEKVAAYWKQNGYTPDTTDTAKAARGARVLTKLHLFEVSPVTVPANRHSDITTVKSFDSSKIARLSDFEEWLRDVAGLSWKDSKEFVYRFKMLLRDVGSANEPDTQEKVGDPSFSMSRFEAQVIALKTRMLAHAGVTNEQISGVGTDRTG